MSDRCNEVMPEKEFFVVIERCLTESVVHEKLERIDRSYSQFLSGDLSFQPEQDMLTTQQAGFPECPVLMEPKKLPKRHMNDQTGRVALLHAITHIEFNAINLALDALYRFRDMPDQYYADWFRVVVEEVKHFRLLNERLLELDSEYGALPAHKGLWDMARDTQGDILERMALVPRYLEARGLDVTPGMIRKLENVGDQKSAEILRIILHDEIGHVKVGTDWFHHVCKKRCLDPAETFFALIKMVSSGKLRGPLNLELRKQAGFSQKELAKLTNILHATSSKHVCRS